MNCLASSAPSLGRNHPPGDVAAEDVQDDVEIKVGPSYFGSVEARSHVQAQSRVTPAFSMSKERSNS
jgi:hypothetical protein